MFVVYVCNAFTDDLCLGYDSMALLCVWWFSVDGMGEDCLFWLFSDNLSCSVPHCIFALGKYLLKVLIFFP